MDDDALQAIADEHQVTVCLLRAIGEFVPAQAPLLEVVAVTSDGDELCDAVVLGRERNLDEDVGFGLRQLVDSPSARSHRG